MKSTELGEKYQTRFLVKDKRFNTAVLSQYHLSIYINDVYVKICCVNAVTKRCLLFEEYRLVHACTHQRIQAIEQLYRDHSILSAKGWATATLCISNQKYTVIPQALFQEKTSADYLSFTCPVGSDASRHFTHSALNATVVFAIDAPLLDWFKSTYKHTKLHVIHQASCLIQGIWHYLQDKGLSKSPKVIVFIEPNNLHVTVMKKGGLTYYNRFAYTDCDELLYYILIVMRTLKLDAGLHEVILVGDIHKRSPAYKKASDYIRRLTFMQTPPHIRFGRAFSKKMRSIYLDILSAHLCH